MRVICKGGLGNQMFQYAFALRLANEGYPVTMETKLFDILNIHNGYEIPNVFALKKTIPSSNSSSLVMRFVLKWKFWPIANEKFPFTDSIIGNNRLFYNGYWQSEKWFASIKDQIYYNFDFKGITKKNLIEVQKMNDCESVSIHIRRGDYLNTSLYKGCCEIDYFKKAISYIRTKKEFTKLWIFSNDIQWCKESLLSFVDKNTVFVDWNNGTISYQDMYLMTQCKNNIIANSSFSWWGAYLNQHHNKIVIAPKRWTNAPFEQYKDIIPESWIKI